MATNNRNRYNPDFDERGNRTESRKKQSSKNSSKISSKISSTEYSSPTFNTEAVSRSLEQQADNQVRKARRDITYSTGPLPADTVNRSRRSEYGSNNRSTRPVSEPVSRDLEYEERYRNRKKLRQEAAKWRRAHWIVRSLIVVVLILDILLLRFGVFKGGFLPVWNILTAGRSTTTTTEETAESSSLHINEQLLTVNEYSRPGTALTAVNGLVIHYIGNPGTDAQENRNYFENLQDGASGVYASCNYIIGLDGTIIQCIPDNEVAYASGERNSDTISIECCHPDESGAFTTETFNALVQLTAHLCKEYNLTTDQILRHYDVNGKPCPKFFVDDPDSWSNFINSVAACM